MKDYRKLSKSQLIDRIIELEVLLSQQMGSAPGMERGVEVQGGVSFRTREPFIQMRSGEAAWQMTPAQARQHALIILDSAVEAERDAATIAFLSEAMDMPIENAATFLDEMRKHRKDWIDEFRKMEPVTSTPLDDAS